MKISLYKYNLVCINISLDKVDVFEEVYEIDEADEADEAANVDS